MLLPYRKTPYTERRRSVYKSPHPKKFQTHESQEGSNNVTSTSASSITNTTDFVTITELDCNLDDINNQLESILNMLDSVSLYFFLCVELYLLFFLKMLFGIIADFFCWVFSLKHNFFMWMASNFFEIMKITGKVNQLHFNFIILINYLYIWFLLLV